jgi:integrase
VAVEQWLRSLALAPKTKVNLRSLFHLVYQHGWRWELIDGNPIELVRQRGGRQSIPRVLSVYEIRRLLEELGEPYRTMVLVAVCLGLRASEIMGLQWGDFNWDDLTLLVKRSVVHGRAGDTKTEASRLALPIDPHLAAALEEQRKRSLYTGPQDWVFANRADGPRSQESIHGISSRLRRGPALARLAGTLSDIPIPKCCELLTSISRCNKSCSDTLPSKAQ